MKICHVMEWESVVEGGVMVSTRQQRTALRRAGVEFTPDPSDEYDVLHVNFPGPRSLAAVLTAKAAGRKVVVHAHSIGENIAGTYRFSRALAPLIKRYYRTIYERADAVVAVNEYVRERLRANGVDGDVVVVSNGVDCEALDGHEDCRYETDGSGTDLADDPGPTVVNLAQVYEIKGVDDFVRVGESLSETDFYWFGPKHRYLAPRRTKRTVARAPPNVRFPGFVEDKRVALGMGDVFFFPTRRDNQPIAVLEAAYCGLPIVTRDVPAFDGWLEHGVNCLVGDSVREFVAHLERLRREPALRERLGENASEMAAAHSLGAVGRELRAVYERVLDG